MTNKQTNKEDAVEWAEELSDGVVSEEEFFSIDDGFPRVATHSGTQHLDDVTGVSILVLALGIAPEMVVRTRREDILEKMDILVDVGKDYDPKRGRFDHHQWESPESGPRRESGIPMASAGLIWMEHGREAILRVLRKGVGRQHRELLADDIVEEIHSSLDRFLIAPIDALDVGHKMLIARGDNGRIKWVQASDPEGQSLSWGPCLIPNLSKCIARYVPTWLENKSSKNREAFTRSVYVMSEMIQRDIVHSASEALAARAVRQAVENSPEDLKRDQILLLDRPIPWQKAVCKIGGIRFVVSPDKLQSHWIARSVPNRPLSRELDSPFPEEWCGLEGEALDLVTGDSVPKGALSARKEGFMATHKKKAGAIAMAREARRRMLQESTVCG